MAKPVDGFGDVQSITDPLGHVTKWTYDQDRNRVTATDPNGNQTKYVYDGGNRMTQEIDGYGSPIAATTTFGYDKVGNLIWTKDGRAHGVPSQSFHIDTSGKQVFTYQR